MMISPECHQDLAGGLRALLTEIRAALTSYEEQGDDKAIRHFNSRLKDVKEHCKTLSSMTEYGSEQMLSVRQTVTGFWVTIHNFTNRVYPHTKVNEKDPDGYKLTFFEFCSHYDRTHGLTQDFTYLWVPAPTEETIIPMLDLMRSVKHGDTPPTP